jgi:DNA-binding SARP family transcriptional activator
MDMTVRFNVLGPLEVTVGDQPVPVNGRRQRELLAVLLLRANRAVPVGTLVDMAWRDRPPPTAVRQVQNSAGRLRRALARHGAPEALIGTVPGGYVLHAGPDQLDALAFASGVNQAREAAAERRLATAVAGFRDALALWRGPALAGFDAELIAAETVRLEEQRLAVLEDCLDLELELGRHHEAAAELAGLVREHPLRERLWAQLMLALHRAGRTAEALAAYQRARARFVDKLGIEPGPELRRLEQAILAQDPAVAAPDPGGLADDRPDDRAAPGRATVEREAAGQARPCQLPPDLADFTGRHDTAALLERLLRGGDRGGPVVVAAICGMAGVGKTTLAVHVAHRVHGAFPNGQLYADLHGAEPRPTAPAEVLARFLRALGVDGRAIPSGTEERAVLYRERLAARRVLVVLDNAADEAQVQPLLPGSASCGVVMTSRARLGGLVGARAVELDVLGPEEAVELLARVAGRDRVSADPAGARELVRLCGCLPLALRVAGARLAARPHWSLAKLAERLVGAGGRLDELAHGPLGVRASLTLSYQGLDPVARRLFRLLGLLQAPDVAAWAAAALLDTGMRQAEEALDRLADARLVEAACAGATGQARYRFHDLVRLYASERAEADQPPGDRDAALERALSGWLALAERAHQLAQGEIPHALDGEAPRWRPDPETAAALLADPMAWLESERRAIVAAVGQAAAAGLTELSWRLASLAVVLFEPRSYFDDWRETHELALAATRRDGDHRGTARMLFGLGGLAMFQERHEAARASYEAALAAYEAAGDRPNQSLVLRDLAYLDHAAGRYDAALGRFALALDRCPAADRAGRASILFGAGHVHAEQERYEQARRDLAEALALFRQLGDRRGEAYTLFVLGEAELDSGQLDHAERSFERMLELLDDVGDRMGQGAARYGLGRVSARRRRHGEAVRRLDEALGLARELGYRSLEARALLAIGQLHLECGRRDQAGAVLSQAHEAVRELRLPLIEARVLDTVGDFRHASGDGAAARAAWAGAHTLYERLGSRRAGELAAKLAPAPATAR